MSALRPALVDARPADASPRDAFGRMLTGQGGAWLARTGDGRVVRLPVERWLGEPTPAERELLARARGPVLDVACGPGRLVAALAARGVAALGVDLAPAAVRAARRRGASAVVADVLCRVPREGSWSTVLVLDGGIGIGGDPAALLARMAGVLTPDGEALVELDAPSARTGPLRVRLESTGTRSGWFSWARVSAAGIEPVAAGAGLAVRELWQAEGRWFARLRRDPQAG